MGYVNASVVRNKDRLDLWKCNILTFQCIMSQNDQTHFKNLSAFALKDFNVRDIIHCIKGLESVNYLKSDSRILLLF